MSQSTNNDFPLQEYYSKIYRTYDLVNRIFTFGQDKKWRLRAAIACLRGNPDRILDLCCGTGDLALEIARLGGSHLKITGYDLNGRMLDIARKKAEQANIQSVEFLEGDAGSMPFANGEFDRITIGFGFRNLTWENPQRETHLNEISRIIKPGGRLMILESAIPRNPWIRIFYRLYLRLILVPLGGLLSGNWNAYRYLARSSSGFYDFATLQAMLRRFKLDLEVENLYLLGSVNLLIATREGT